jgi:hypothetical protein
MRGIWRKRVRTSVSVVQVLNPGDEPVVVGVAANPNPLYSVKSIDSDSAIMLSQRSRKTAQFYSTTLGMPTFGNRHPASPSFHVVLAAIIKN